MTRPPFIIRSNDVPEEPGRYPGSDEVLSLGRAIGRAAGLQRIGIHLERLPSGTRTSWPHAEERDEEFVYVLAGEVHAWIDGHLHPMRQGDFAAFPAGTGICHTFINQGPGEVLLLAGGQRTSPENRIYYPLHSKERAETLGERWWADWPKRELGPHDGRPSPRGAWLERSYRALSVLLAVLGLMQWVASPIFFREWSESALWFFNGGTTLLLLGALNLAAASESSMSLRRLTLAANFVMSAFWAAMSFALWSKFTAHPASFTGPVVTFAVSVLSLVRGRRSEDR
jgi:uncharacterized cupin superfamily protein